MAKNKTINVDGTEITIISKNINQEYISLTDMARSQLQEVVREHPFNKIPIISLYDSTFVLWKRYPHN